MMKIKSLDDLRKMKEELQSRVNLRENVERCDEIVQIRVAMATCGIAAGGKEIMNLLVDTLDRRAIEAVVTQTGCMGYCYAEPTIEVTLPGNEPVVFGDVDAEKAVEIVEKYIKNGELLEGIIPVNYEVVDNY